MGKILGSWSGMRKYLEQEMLAPALHGRVRYGCTTYVGMDGCRIFEVCIDGRQVKRFSWETVNPLVRMFAVLDRRVGKRTLEKLALCVDEQPAWLREFYLLRLEAEKII